MCPVLKLTSVGGWVVIPQHRVVALTSHFAVRDDNGPKQGGTFCKHYLACKHDRRCINSPRFVSIFSSQSPPAIRGDRGFNKTLQHSRMVLQGCVSSSIARTSDYDPI